MAKAIIENRGLKIVPLEERHILPLAENLSPENLRELEVVYNVSVSEALSYLGPDELVFVVEREGNPVAVTGIVLREESLMMWALFTTDLRKHWISFARASAELIKFYHTMRDTIHCEVWTENEMIHQWLVHLGFDPECFIELQNGQSVVRFVRCQGEQEYVQRDTLRPVLH